MDKIVDHDQNEYALVVAEFWINFLVKNSIQQGDYVIVLMSDDNEVNYYTLHFLAAFKYQKNARKILIVGAYDCNKERIKAEATARYKLQLVEPTMIAGLGRVLSSDSLFDRILVNDFLRTEAVDALELVGINGIQKKDIVARGVLRLSEVPSEVEIEKRKNCVDTLTKTIDWDKNAKWLPSNNGEDTPEGLCSKLLEQLQDNQVITTKDKLYIFGKTRIAEVILDKLISFNILGILDNRAFDGEEYIGLPVYSPQSILYPYDYEKKILVSNLRYKEVAEQLYAYGYKLGEQVFILNYNPKYDNNKLNVECYIKDLRVKCLQGKRIYEKLRVEFPDNTFVVCPYKSGDIYLFNLYMKEYLHHFCIHNAKIIVFNRGLQKLCDLMGMPSAVVDRYNIELLMYWARAEDRKDIVILDVNQYQRKNSSLLAMNNMDYNTWIQKLLFRADERKSMFSYFQQNNSNDIIEKYGLNTNSSIIIAPYAYSIPLLPITVWQELVLKLNQLGYHVFTNASDEEEAIEGTEKIFISYEQIFRVLDSCRVFIAMRSGLCDIISSSRCKMIILYQGMMNGNFRVIDFFSLEKMGLKKDNLVELNYDDYMDQDKLIFDILQEI